MNKLKIINDPIYGFVDIPNELLFDIIQHPYFQRLRRISQMGLSFLVYPGAHHTRFHHAIGAMHLMQTALNTLKNKDVEITPEEEEATLIAILLHDIGHGAFSHALEYSIINISHETISLKLMQELNEEFNGKLDLAIQIFSGKYHKKFLLELISSQIDVDRLDYLRRDSFYSGVIEGQVNSDRLIKMFNVKDNQLVIDEKGIYSVEKFIISRRLMYWQVYLHKTGMMLEKILEKILARAVELLSNHKPVFLDDNLRYLFEDDMQLLNNKSIEIFTQIDDSDILYHIKKWTNNQDFILSYLSKMIINRENLNRILIQKEAFSPDYIDDLSAQVLEQFPIEKHDLSYLLFHGKLTHRAYNIDSHPIKLLDKSNKIIEFSEASDQLNIQALSHPVTKYYLSYPRIKKL
jgi:HD superfamily phosphohydrolase